LGQEGLGKGWDYLLGSNVGDFGAFRVESWGEILPIGPSLFGELFFKPKIKVIGRLKIDEKHKNDPIHLSCSINFDLT